MARLPAVSSDSKEVKREVLASGETGVSFSPPLSALSASALRLPCPSPHVFGGPEFHDKFSEVTRSLGHGPVASGKASLSCGLKRLAAPLLFWCPKRQSKLTQVGTRWSGIQVPMVLVKARTPDPAL